MRAHSALFFILVALAGTAWAEPQYSALFGQSCFLCHTNPTGRGMRSLYGSQFFAPTYLPIKPVSFELLEKLKPRLSESVIIGADLRTIWMSQSDTSSAGLSGPLSTNTGTMSQMEGYLYLSLQPTDQLSIYYSQGVAQASGRFEAYGVADVLPFKGFVKIGQFQENYGWVFADHTAFVRTGLFGEYSGMPTSIPTPPHYGIGAELGLRPKNFDFTVSYTNAQTTIPRTADTQKRWVARLMAQQGIEKMGLQFSLGGSWYHAPYKAVDPANPFGSPEMKRLEAWGGFGGIGWTGLADRFGCHSGFGFLTSNLLLEYDRRAWVPIDNLGNYLAPATSAYCTAMLSTMVQPGIWLTAGYDWLDNDEFSDGREAERTSIGLQVFPLPWIDIQPRYRLYTPADGTHNVQLAEMQVHFSF